MSGLAAALSVAAGLFAEGSLAQEGQAPDSLGIRLVDAPIDRRDDPRAQRSIIDHLQPGAAIERRIELISTLTEPVDVRLYVGAATIADGSFLPADRGAEGNVLTSWTSVDPGRVTAPAGGRASATVRIAVPPDASDGERYGVVWAELPPGGGDVAVVNRVGIRIYLSVGSGGEPESDFEIDSLQASRTSSGEPAVSARVTNVGGRALDFRGELVLLHGPGGATAGPFTAEPGSTLGVDQSSDVIVALDPALPAGPWLARMTLWSGQLERAAEATILFPDAAGEAAEPVEATPIFRDRGFLLPLALGLLLLALSLVFLVWWLRRRRDEDDDGHPDATVRDDATAVAEQ